MDLSNEILLEKYGKEIVIVKSVILGNLNNNISDLKFLEVLKVVLNNNELDDSDFSKISRILDLEEGIFRKIYEEFYKADNKLNVLNFEFPKHIIESSQFENDSKAIENIINILNSTEKNENILKKFRPTDLISVNKLDQINNFLTNYLFDGKIKKSIENLIKELKHKDKYVLIEAKIKEEYNYLLKEFKKEFEGLSKEKEYYARVVYPYVSLHDKTNLKEIITIKLESIEMKYI